MAVVKHGVAEPSSSGRLVDGMAARHLAVHVLHAVMTERRAFDDTFQREAEKANLPVRDRAFARAICGAVLRRGGELSALIGKFIEKPLPAQKGRLQEILLSAAAQLVILKTPPHAAISLAVDQVQADRGARRFDKLANAVLRRVSERGGAILAQSDPASNIPSWLFDRWRLTYGDERARAIALASLDEPSLDITVCRDAALWSEKFGGILLPTGSIRIAEAGRVDELAGYSDGVWWVQDTAAALPARVLGDVSGLSIADLCAAPGGKTAQLATSGAKVTAVELSPARAQRLKANIERLNLDVEVVISDVAAWKPERQFDAVLLDVPCTSTGTIRRHPDILYLKRTEDVASLAQSQTRLFEAAAKHVKPGGRLVYCTCSLEAEEGPEQVDRFLAGHENFRRQPIDAASLGGDASWQTAAGDLRTLPCYLNTYPPGSRGMDGFYVSLLVRTS